ncbi:hypothetical protein EVAR_95442_1 [Eumeta japonica]|uniref:Uncharacterized protein n=1 Tax=Eumeta variegata TaxID=151549 RepID=A0A4C1SCL5_EUMVA|nr:hypothetical protein EVAR_95442_1 [Eumeta japonica]
MNGNRGVVDDGGPRAGRYRALITFALAYWTMGFQLGLNSTTRSVRRRPLSRRPRVLFVKSSDLNSKS